MVISFLNSKGGVGKTISAVNLAATLASTEREVLLIDADGQYSATNFFLVEGEFSGAPTIHDVLFAGCSLTDAAIPVRPQLHLVASDPRMVDADHLLPSVVGADLRLRRAMKMWPPSKKTTTIVDVPSGWGAVAHNSVLASQLVIIPINGEKMAFDTALDTTERIAQLCDAYEVEAPRVRILLTAYRDTNHGREIAELCRQTWGSDVLTTQIRFTERLRELALDQKTVVERACAGARDDFQNLAEEIFS